MLKDVKNLQEQWGSDIPCISQLSLDDLSDTYIQIKEELEEFEELLEKLPEYGIVQDLLLEKELSDVCIDLIFFILQAVVKSGISERFEEDFQKILNNNLTKVCHTEDLARETADYYTSKGEPCYVSYVEKYNHWIVRRVDDNKVKKPLGFKEVEL